MEITMDIFVWDIFVGNVFMHYVSMGNITMGRIRMHNSIWVGRAIRMGCRIHVGYVHMERVSMRDILVDHISVRSLLRNVLMGFIGMPIRMCLVSMGIWVAIPMRIPMDDILMPHVIRVTRVVRKIRMDDMRRRPTVLMPSSSLIDPIAIHVVGEILGRNIRGLIVMGIRMASILVGNVSVPILMRPIVMGNVSVRIYRCHVAMDVISMGRILMGYITMGRRILMSWVILVNIRIHVSYVHMDVIGMSIRMDHILMDDIRMGILVGNIRMTDNLAKREARCQI
jgi:hypothetical protein